MRINTNANQNRPMPTAFVCRLSRILRTGHVRFGYVFLSWLMFCFIDPANAQLRPLQGTNQGSTRLANYQMRAKSTTIRDASGRLITKIEAQYRNYGGSTELAYLGSPFLTYPVWQPGTLVFTNQQQIPAQIAFDTNTDQVFFRLPDQTELTMAQPEQFTVSGRSFIRFARPMGGAYYEVLYAGKVNLLKHYQTNLYDQIIQGGAYNGPREFLGHYRTLHDFYIQQGTDKPRFVMLTKQSLLKVLADKREQLETYIKKTRLTEAEAIDVLAYYNSLNAQPDAYVSAVNFK